MQRARIVLALVVAALLVSAAPVPVAAFNEGVAQQFLFYSYSAYYSKSAIENWSCPYCADSSIVPIDVIDDSEYNLQAYVAVQKEQEFVLVSFRGTEANSLTNWIQDLKFAKADTPFDGISGAYVHSGFLESYNALKQGILSAVRSAQSQFGYSDIYVTGHSLGAAMAELCALDFSYNVGYQVAGLYTYGCPRVGDSGYAQAFEGNFGTVMRMVDDADIVPHLPPQDFGFHHVPYEIWETPAGGGNYKTCDGSGEDPSCSDSVSVIDYSVEDHLKYMGYSCP